MNLENICFKGGGMKGNAFVGVQKALEELNILGLKRFIGSSAGAIFATAAACRIPFHRLNDIINSTNFNLFQDTPGGYIGEGYRLWEEMGIYRGDYFYKWFSNILEQETGDANLTFEKLYNKYNSELIITTVDLTIKKLIYLNKNTHPNMKIADAVRRSMSIPVFFIPVSDIDENGIKHIYIDGGCLNNFPLAYFDDLYPSKEIALQKTIGFNLIENQQISQINNVVDLISCLINTDIEEIERLRLTKDDEKRTININTFGIKSTDFNLSRDLIEKLIDSGYNSTMTFFQKQKQK
jgi:NTE family protein